MVEISNATWNLIKNGTRQVMRASAILSYTTVGGHKRPVINPTPIITSSMILNDTFQCDKYVCKSNFAIGEVVPAEITFQAYQDDFSIDENETHYFLFEIGIKDWTTQSNITWIPIGAYKLHETKMITSKVYQYTFWDRFSDLDKVVDTSLLPSSATLATYANSLIQQGFGTSYDFEVDFSEALFNSSNYGASDIIGATYSFNTSYINNGTTLRALISDIAEMTGGNAMFDCYGNLKFTFCHLAGYEVDMEYTYHDWAIFRPCRYYEGSYGTKDYYTTRQIQWVEANLLNGHQYTETAYGSFGVKYLNNPYIGITVNNNLLTPAISSTFPTEADFYNAYISALIGFYQYACLCFIAEVETLPSPYLEPGDAVVFSKSNTVAIDAEGYLEDIYSVSQLCVMHTTYTLNYSQVIECPAYEASNTTAFTDEQQAELNKMINS